MSRELRLCNVDRLEVRRETDGRVREIVGHAAVFNRNSKPIGGRFVEQVKPGAFSRALREQQDVRALVNHDPVRVLGRSKPGTLTLSEDAQGLAVTIRPPRTTYADDLAVSIDRGDVDQMSFAFDVKRERWVRGGGPGGMDLREILDVDLIDVSTVSFPAYVETDVALRNHAAAIAELRAEQTDVVKEYAHAAPGDAAAVVDAGPASDLEPGETRECFDSHMGLWLMEPTRFAAGLALIQSGAWKPDARALARAEVERRWDDDGPPALTLDERRGYAIVDGVAVLAIEGVMAKRSSKFAPVSTARLRTVLKGAMRDPDVRGVLLRIDSPGGSAAGTPDLASEIAEAEKTKPVHAFIEDLGASAAYWLASQAGKVTANPLAEVGSIGVYSVVFDESEKYRKAGIKVHVVSSGPDKGLGVAGSETSPRLLALVDEHVKRLHTAFSAAIGGGRGLDGARLDAVTTGRTFAAPQAIELGLIDGVGSFEEALAGVRAVSSGAGPEKRSDAPADVTLPAADLAAHEQRLLRQRLAAVDG